MSFGPAGPGFSSGSWMVVHSYYFADGGSSVWDLTGQHRSQRSLFQSKLVLTGSRFFTICKNGRWDFQYHFPFWKALRNLYLNSHKEVHLYFKRKLLAIACTTCRNLQRYFCHYCFYSSFCNFLSQHREAQWMSFFNYCIILPFGLIWFDFCLNELQCWDRQVCFICEIWPMCDHFVSLHNQKKQCFTC